MLGVMLCLIGAAGGRGNRGAMFVRLLSSLMNDPLVFCHDVCTIPCPGGPNPPAPCPAPLYRTGNPEATEEIPLERFEYRLDRDDCIDSRFATRGWIDFRGSRREPFVDLRRTGGLRVQDKRWFCFLEGEVSPEFSSSIIESLNGTNALRLGERGGG